MAEDSPLVELQQFFWPGVRYDIRIEANNKINDEYSNIFVII